MFKERDSSHLSTSIDRIKEAYQGHPCMQSVNALKEQLKQEKLQDKTFIQSAKNKKHSN